MPITVMRVTPATQAAAERIRADAAAQFDRIRNRGELTTDAIQVGLARAYLPAKAQMDKLQAQSTSGGQAEIRKLTAAAFGIDDVAGTSSVDRASASVSYRDAQDRVDGIDSPAEAAALLDRAENSGDELLARAIAQRAWSQRAFDGSWGELLDVYVSTRPRAASALSALLNVQTAKPQIMDFMVFSFPAPPELAGYADFQIAALAASPVPTV